MTLTAHDARYVLRCSFEERNAARTAGFEWDAERRQWFTFRHEIADPFMAHADDAARALRQRAVESSRVSADVPLPVPTGKSYLPYQRAGIAFALGRKHTLIADEMGLGKTIQAIGVINADPSVLRVCIVCPASLRLNWRDELSKWLVAPFSLSVVTAKDKALPKATIHVINYDLLHRHQFPVYDLLIVDEAHYLKNPLARRTKKTLAIRAERKLFLTGTPILSRPIEIYPLLKALDPLNWPSRAAFGARYCAGFLGDWGMDFSGASNLDELHDKLRSTIMIRRLKKDVLTELPPKQRQIVEFTLDGIPAATVKRDAATLAGLRKLGSWTGQVEELKRAKQDAFENITAVRHETALAKVPKVVEYVTDVLESEPKVVVFAHHRDVIELLRAGLAGYGAVTLTGDTPMADRKAAVEKFQTDAKTRVFIGNIMAAGTGITLTAASHVIFAELDWVPGNMSQAEDRCHRIGQRDHVLVQHLVLERSLDSYIAKTLVKKQAILDQAIDGAKAGTDWLENFREAFTTNAAEKHNNQG